MSAITAQTVNDLRQRTGAGLMDCKKALTESNGNIEEAITLLRKKLGAKVNGEYAQVAQTRAQREQGLMGVTSLDGRDGMIFRMPTAAPVKFWMKNTVMPLTALWFGADGALQDTVDMNPCKPDAATCDTYGPKLDSLNVIELPQGAADRWGIARGASLEGITLGCSEATRTG